MNINIIVAYCKNNGIGINNSLPWKIKTDLKKFKKLTCGNGNNAIIMGKNTWLSINSQGLPNRDNLILSSTLNINILNDNNNNNNNNNNISKSFNNMNELEDFIKIKNYDEIWIIGGERIYNQFMNDYDNINGLLKINKIYITYIDSLFECDSYFPNINLDKFKFKSMSVHDNNVNLKIYDIIYIS